MYRNHERREGRPPTSSVRGDEGRLVRIPLIDLSKTGEGPVRTGSAAPVDGEKLLREIREIRMPKRTRIGGRP